MRIKEKSVLYLFGIIAVLSLSYYRSVIGYLSPDELYFTNFENVWNAQVRYVVPITVFSSAWSLGYYGAAFVNFPVFYLLLRKERQFVLLAVLTSPFILFYFASYLREILVSLIIFSLVFSRLVSWKKLALSGFLLLLRPEHFIVTIVALAVAKIASSRLACILLLLVVSMTAFVVIEYYSDLHYAYSIRLAETQTFYQQDFGILGAVGMRDVSLVDVFVNFVILLFTFPVQSDGFIRLAMYFTFFSKVIMAVVIARHFLTRSRFTYPIAAGLNVLTMFMLIALFQSYELAGSRWFLPTHFVFIGLCAHILPSFSFPIFSLKTDGRDAQRR